jgi:hypothetical protein
LSALQPAYCATDQATVLFTVVPTNVATIATTNSSADSATYWSAIKSTVIYTFLSTNGSTVATANLAAD